MQETHKVTIGISPICEIVKSQCSCADCDSTSCFAKRRMVPVRPHDCEDCDSKSCLFYNANINLTESKSGSLNIKDIKIEITKEHSRGLLKKEIPTQDKNNHIPKKQSKISYKIADSKEKNDNPSSKEHSVSAANSYNEVSPSIARLSAKIMDVTYKDFQKSVSKPRFPPTLNNISPYDIFSRIKEAYKACSCKVCECLIGKSLKSDICKCKPCECSDCMTFNRQVKSFNNRENLFPADDDGCPCIRCERGSCKGVGQGKNKQECDCVGVLKCEYLKNDSFTRACDCEPCHCIECEPRSIHRHRTMIVAPISEDISRRNECQCNPCECFECGRGFRLASHLQNEMSTSMNRHPHCQCELCINEACIPDSNQFCSCAKQSKVMSKPFQKDSHDYDIRRAAVTYNEALRHKEANYDTIAMFAAISNSYPEREKDKKRCDCDQCECLDCKYMENVEISSKVFKPIQNYRLSNLQDSHKFLPSESTSRMKQDSRPFNSKKENVCSCEECDCLTCDGLAKYNAMSDIHKIKKLNDKFSAKGDCSCDPCECTACEKLMTSCVGDICLCSNCEDCVKENFSDEVIYPVKKGEKLTPEIFRSKVKDAFIESCISTLVENDELLKQTAMKSSSKKMSAFSSYQKTKTRDDYSIGVSNQRISQNNYTNNLMDPRYLNARTETVKHAHMSNNNVKNEHSRSFEPPLESNLSTYSSMSFLNESGSITPARYKLKSWESSCNSSGHDYPNYLVHFPKTTVETCLNDIMQFDAVNKNNINLNQTALTSKNNVRKLNRDLYASARQLPRIVLPMRTAFSVETPTNGLPEEDSFKYSAQIFEDHPYRPRTSKTTSEVYGKPKENHTSELTSESRPYLRHSTATNNLNRVTVNLDYECVQNTLKEAREFSMHLVQLLEKYEKANREFESVAEKIKKSNHYNISNKVSGTNSSHLKYPNTKENFMNTLYTDQVPTKEQQQSSVGSSAEVLVEVKKNIIKNDNFQFIKNPISISEDQANSLQNIISETCYEVYETNEGRNESGDNVNKINETLKTITEEREPLDVSNKQDKKRKVLAKLHKKYNKMYKRSVISSKRIKSSTNSSNVEVDATETIISPILETYRIIDEKQNNFELRNHKVDNIMVDYKANLPKSPENINLSKLVNKSTTELRVSVTEKFTKDKHFFQKDVVMIKEPMIEHSRNIVEFEEDKELPILKKNFCLDTNTTMHSRKISLPTPLEKDVKAASKTISRQHNSENATYLYENRALIKLHSEVKKLLDLPILQSSERTSQNNCNNVLYNNLSKSSSSQTNQGVEDGNIPKSSNITAVQSKNSCDTMKVNFLNVRRVSDHTVLVKWNTPRVLTNVLGYELLVDGRAVQKILSPSRRLAVVTCLPHTDKVLLTVRTVVSPPRQGHSPITTVIYQPKIK